MPVTLPELPNDIFVPPVLHVPPAVVVLNVIVNPAQTVDAPVIPEGAAFTVTRAVAIHPTPVANVIVAVPAATPLTIPEVPTVAT